MTKRTGRLLVASLAAAFLSDASGVVSLTAALRQSLSAGLVGYWELDETAGTIAADSSGNGNTGTHVNGPVISTDVPAPIASFSARSLQFAAANDTSVDVPDSASLSVTGEITVAAWIKPTASAATQKGIVEKWTWNATLGVAENGYYLRLSSTDRIRCAVVGATGGSQDATGTTPIPLNAWTHVAGTFDPVTGTIYVYVNGAMDGSASVTTAPTDGTAALMIGNAQGANQFTGLIDDVRVYNRVLTASEIASLASGGGGPPPPPPPPPPPGGSGGRDNPNGNDGINDACWGGSSIAASPAPAGWLATLLGLALLSVVRRR